jgi:hypothetical protein
MVRCVVVDAAVSRRLISLRDDAGRYHVGHCLSFLPEVQQTLTGDLPSTGLAHLTDELGSVYRMLLVQMDRDEQDVWGELHRESAPWVRSLTAHESMT